MKKLALCGFISRRLSALPATAAHRFKGSDECPHCQQLLCPACLAAVSEDDLVCPQCGAEFELVCPVCETAVSPDATVCPVCGEAL
ncbi:MAG: zinc ribbon domain-containing protein [Ardenticatenaceae bacterium]|nr:zinc ribbon domain-containing protein [Ardenticatenaceae bacterium]